MEIKRLLRPSVRALKPYDAKEIPCRVKLDANESPYPVKIKIPKGLKSNRYPDPMCLELRKAYAKTIGSKAERMLAGNGSDELIYYIICAFGGPVMFPSPTFSMYGIIASSIGEKSISVPLGPDFGLDAKAMARQIKKLNPKITFIASPNNPTGNSFGKKEIEAVVRASSGIVVVDEAYQQFSMEESFVRSVAKYENLLIMRTLSKVGLAGLRVGFLIGNPALVEAVNRVRLPFNVNALSQSAALYALSRGRALNSAIGRIVAARRKMFKEMSLIEGVKPFRSDANFILFKAEDSGGVWGRLLRQGVLVRNLGAAIPGCLRVTVGAPGENKAFIKALRKAVID